MNTADALFKRPRRNITWQTQQPLPFCIHQYEPTLDSKGVTIQRCVKCGLEETP